MHNESFFYRIFSEIFTADPRRKEDSEDENVIEVVPDTDALLEHITTSGLPLRSRRPTLSDGNCWWDASADQVCAGVLVKWASMYP